MKQKSSPGEEKLVALADRLHSAAIHLLRRVRREDVASGLSVARLSALSVVVYAGPIRMGELAEAEQVKPPTMSRLVNGLEGEGLVRRIRDGADGRVTQIEATAEGKRVLETGRRRRVAHLADLLVDLNRQELGLLSQATAILEKVQNRSPGTADRFKDDPENNA